jgi:energy-coupling factor transporter ATP-binding protein EcfA2
MGRVLMLDPGVFLLDEPTANLAPRVAADLLDGHVRQLAAGGASVLIVEQRARAVLAVADQTYVLGGGEVRMEGTRPSWPPVPTSSSRSWVAAATTPARRAPPDLSATRPVPGPSATRSRPPAGRVPALPDTSHPFFCRIFLPFG